MKQRKQSTHKSSETRSSEQERRRNTRIEAIRDDGTINEGGGQTTEESSQEEDIDTEKLIEWMKPFGDERDSIQRDQKHTMRIATLNVNTFPKVGTYKSRCLQQEITHLDCIGMSEINRNWFKINQQDQFRRRIDQWWQQQKTNLTWLHDHEWPSEFQQGGVSLTTTGAISAYVQDKGEDLSGLGRWTWQIIEGHSETKTAIIQVYRPVRNETNDGSTYKQQQVAADTEKPLDIFDSDLLELTDNFIEDNHEIILMGDFNMAINGKCKLERELNERGIRDIIQERYQTKPPASHARGSQAIDGIFATENITMISGGYEPGKSEISDHRMIWADITLDSCLGIDRGEIVRPKGRKLQTNNPKKLKRFNREFERQIKIHKLVEKARDLEKDIGDSRHMTDIQARKYETIDEQRERATARADDKCANQTPSDDPFSPELKEAIIEVSLYNEMRKRLESGRRIHKRWLIRKTAQWGTKRKYLIPLTLDDAKQALKEATEKYKIIQKKTPELRTHFLDRVLRQAEDSGDSQKAKDIRAIKEREATRDVHKRLKFAQGKLRGGGVRFIHRAHPDGRLETIKNKFEMEKEITKSNEEKLHAANESPIRQGEIAAILTDQDYDQWERLIAGELDLPDDMEEGTKLWFEQFVGQPIQEKDVKITRKSYTNGWNKAKENTSCAPGSLHFGTFKAMKGSPRSAELHAIMARIPIRTGYTPKRWRTSVDSMLPKKKGEWRPGKLRLTSLLMPDYNHNNKILGRWAMAEAEDKGLLATEQYGSRKNLSAAKHALNKRLMLDIHRVQRKPGILCANDAKACYDRILHIAAYVALRRTGLKREAVISMLEPIRELKHYIRTAYGDSNIHYGGKEWKRDPSGICQGNGAGPAIWALVSSPLLEILRKQGYGTKLHSAIGDEFIHLAGFAFVDDADTIQDGHGGEKTETLLRKAQAQLDLWESCIRTTGGGIEGDKTDYAIMNYTWTGGKWKYEDFNERNKMTVHNPNGEREELTQLRTSKARRTLGVWQAIDGNEREQTKQMESKSKKWSRAVFRSSAGRSDTTIGIKTSLYPSVTYGMMATTLTDKQCERVFKPIRAGPLRKAGFSKSTPAVVIHGPKKFGGVGLNDFYTIQGTEHVKVLCDEAGTQSPTGKLMNILIHGHTLEIGTGGRLFDTRMSKTGHLMTYSWIKHTLQFAQENNITVRGAQETLQTWRANDVLIMDQALRTPGDEVTEEDLAAANRCRIYLQVCTKSDISTGDGQRMMRSAWEVTRNWTAMSKTAYRWPYQERPDRRDIEAWQRVIGKAFQLDTRELEWGVALGRFDKKARRHTKWMFDRSNDSLYERRGDNWRRWRQVLRRTRSKLYVPTDEEITATQKRWEIAQVTIRLEHEIAMFEGSAPTRSTEPTRSQDHEEAQHSNLQDIVDGIDESLQWIVDDVTLPEDEGRKIAAQIIRSEGKCISDGSLKAGRGTAAAFFFTEDGDTEYVIQNRTPGEVPDQSSYRSELCGIFANIVMVNAITRFHGVENGKVTIACDNESALWTAFDTKPVTTTYDSFDLLKAIRHEISKSTIEWKPKHVRGHQDRDDGAILDVWAHANMHADALAESYWTQVYQTEDPGSLMINVMPGEGWRIETRGVPITKAFGDKIHEQVYRGKMMSYWERKERMAPGMGIMVDWEKYKGALKLCPLGKQQWTQKHYCGFEGTNSMMYRWKKRNNFRCPKCNERENYRHVVRCQSDEAIDNFQEIGRNLKQWLDDTTSSDMREAIWSHIRAYRENTPVEEDESWSDDVMAASRVQEAIGKNAFGEGFITDMWEDIQDRYNSEIRSTRHAGRWTKELIKKIWMVSWDMWEHRNGWIHNEGAVRKEQIIAQLDEEINTLHSTGAENRFLVRLEKTFFQRDIQPILEATEYRKRTWIHTAKRFIERDRQRVARNRSIRVFREFLIPGSTDEIMRQQTRVINDGNNNLRAPDGTRRRPDGNRD